MKAWTGSQSLTLRPTSELLLLLTVMVSHFPSNSLASPYQPFCKLNNTWILRLATNCKLVLSPCGLFLPTFRTRHLSVWNFQTGPHRDRPCLEAAWRHRAHPRPRQTTRMTCSCTRHSPTNPSWFVQFLQHHHATIPIFTKNQRDQI